MAEQELSLIRFCVINFFGVLLNTRPFQPTATLLIKLVKALINAEPTPDEKVKARVKWIYENTHSKVETHLSIVELVVFRNLEKGVNKEIDLGNKTFHLSELYNILDEISTELTTIVINTAKKYSIDIPMGIGAFQQQPVKISLEDETKKAT
jgi:hypothetical protein